MKLSFGHRVGNTIQGLICICENLLMVITFSHHMPNWSMRFIMWRLDKKWLYGKRKTVKS